MIKDIEDPTTAKILTKFKTRFQKQHRREFDRVKGDSAKYANKEEFREICELVDIELPEARQETGEEGSDHEHEPAEEDVPAEEEEEEEDEDEDELPRKKGQDRRRGALREHNMVDEDENEVEGEEVEEDNAEEEDESVHSRSVPASRSPTPPPPQKMKKRRGPPPPPDSPDPYVASIHVHTSRSDHPISCDSTATSLLHRPPHPTGNGRRPSMSSMFLCI